MSTKRNWISILVLILCFFFSWTPAYFCSGLKVAAALHSYKWSPSCERVTFWMCGGAPERKSRRSPLVHFNNWSFLHSFASENFLNEEGFQNGRLAVLALHGFPCHPIMHMNMVTVEYAERAAPPSTSSEKAPTGLTPLRSSFALKKMRKKKKPNSCETIGRWNFNFTDSLGFAVTHEAPAILFFFRPVYLKPNVSVLILHNWGLDLFRMHSLTSVVRCFHCCKLRLEFSIKIKLLKVSRNDLFPSSVWKKALCKYFLTKKNLHAENKTTFFFAVHHSHFFPVNNVLFFLFRWFKGSGESPEHKSPDHTFSNNCLSFWDWNPQSGATNQHRAALHKYNTQTGAEDSKCGCVLLLLLLLLLSLQTHERSHVAQNLFYEYFSNSMCLQPAGEFIRNV